MKKKKLFDAIKFIAISLVGLSVIAALFAPFILSYSQK
jgi:uncharacterized membrane protein